MANSWQQTIKDWTIRRKILTGFAMVLALTTALGWQALPGARPAQRRRQRRAGRGADLPGLPDDDPRSSWWSRSASACSSPSALARLIADPLTQLGILAEQVSKGDLTTDIRSKSRDEIGWLEHSMRQMVKNLREIATQIAVSSRAVATVGRGDLLLVVPDGQGRGDAVQLDRGDLVHDGRDRLPDAEPGPQRRGAGRERGPDLGLDPGDERHAHPDGRERRGAHPRGRGGHRARSAP